MLYEDRQNPGANYMGLDPTDFVREADLSNTRFQQFKNSLTLIEGNQNEMLQSVRDLTTALNDKTQIRKDVAEMVEKVMLEGTTNTTNTNDVNDNEPDPEPPLLFSMLNRRKLYGLN